MSFEISKEELYKIYILEKNNIEDITKIYNVSKDMVKRKLHKYNIHKDRKEIYEQSKNKYFKTMNERYGVDFPIQNNEIKQKIISKAKEFSDEKKQKINEKKKKTCREKFGTDYALQSPIVREKIINTNIKKYGFDNPMKNFKIKKKMQKTCIKKYGVDNVFKLKKYQDKADETMIKKYGVKNSSQSKVIKAKQEKTCEKRYGNKYYCLIDKCRQANGHTISKTNQEFSKRLRYYDIPNKLEKTICNKSYDIEILYTNIVLEINPTYTHNSTLGGWFNKHQREPLNKNYHLEKTLNAKENGYKCIHIFDWDDKDKIIDILKPKDVIPARLCTIRNVNIKETEKFLNKYHLQGHCKGQDIRLGLFYEDKLVQIMTFGKPRYNKKYEYELLRLCSISDYYIIGGSNKLFKNFIRKYNPKSIVSYCDNSKFDGNVYNNLGFKLLDYGKPSKHWYNQKTKKHITDNLLRQRGFDQLFNANYGKGTSNKELMIEHGFVEIYDCGQSVYIYNGENNG